MKKREYCESRESIAYYSGLNGLEIKGIEYGINDYLYCVSGCWYGGKAAQRYHRLKIQYDRRGGAFVMNIDSTMKELAEYIRMGEEIAANIDALKDALKQYMRETGVDSLTGTEHKASYKAVTSSRIDTSALKKDAPEIAAKYTRTTESRRFTFA